MSGQLGTRAGEATQGSAIPTETVIRYQDLHDPLTELPGWVLLLDRISVALLRARRLHRAIAVYGIEYLPDPRWGDDGSAIAFITRIQLNIRPDDTLALLEPGRYALLCSDLRGPADAERIADRLKKQLDGPLASVQLSVAVGTGDDEAVRLLSWATRQ